MNAITSLYIPRIDAHIDAEKTALLRSILASFKKQCRDDVESFDAYLRNMYDAREKWLSE